MDEILPRTGVAAAVLTPFSVSYRDGVNVVTQRRIYAADAEAAMAFVRRSAPTTAEAFRAKRMI